jgi:hypothetical protein
MKQKKFLIIGFALFCFVLGLSMYIFLNSETVIGNYANAVIDAQFCIPRIAAKIGSSATYSAIKNAILSLLHRGLLRSDVIKILESIAPINIGKAKAKDDGFSEEVVINLCSNPLNNLILQV